MCVAVTEEDGRRQCIRRRDCTLVYAPVGVASGVIVEVEPLPQHRIDEAPGDAWVRPNERPRLEVNLQDPKRRIAFNVGILPAEAKSTLKQAYAYLEVATTFAASGTRESKRAALSSAAAWAKSAHDVPRDVNRGLLGGDVAGEGQHPLGFHSALNVASFAVHACERHDELIKIASRKPEETARKAKRKGKNPSEAPPVPVVTLRFTEQHVEVHSRFSDTLPRHRDHVRPTKCAEVAVSVRDWAVVSRELATLELVERSPEEPALELSVWPAGMLRLTARTELATIRIWVPLLNPHTGERSYALMERMQFEPWPDEIEHGAVELTDNFVGPEEPVSSPEAAPASGGQQDSTGSEPETRDDHE
jgi:hypothetical protein